MKFNKLMLVVFVIGLLAVPALAQRAWEKPIEKWDKEAALNVLKESPWAQSYQSAEGSAAAERAQSSLEQADQRLGRAEWGRTARGLGPQPVVVRLQSGLPIRQALVRLQQIEMGYDRMDAEKRAKYDAEAKTFLDCKICQDYYVVTLTKFKRSASEGVDEAMFQTLKMEDLKGNVQLVNDKGEQRELIYFLAPKQSGESATLYFKRKDNNGNLLLTPESKTVKLVFNRAFLDNRTNPYGALLPRHFEFKVPKLIINDQLAF